MIVLALCFAVLAALGFVGSPAGRTVARRLDAAGDAPGGHRRRLWPLVAAVGGAGVVAAFAFAGASAGVNATAVAMIAATVGRLSRQRMRLRAALAARTEVSDACGALASQVRIGRIPAEALRAAAEDCPVLHRASATQDLGGDVVTTWRLQARERGRSGLAELAQAWQVASSSGAPMASAVEQVAAALAADEAVRSLVAGELAGPRATGQIMAVLPLFGMTMGYALGGDPVHFLVAGPMGWACLLGGVALAAAGLLWIDALAQQVATE